MEMPSTDISKNRRRVCFSFAAYAKTLIDHLKTYKIPVLEGLSDEEFAVIESSVGFVFPPDLRSILREGLPVGPGFPNWRSSPQQLRVLIDLPVSVVCGEISKRKLWCRSWGRKPENPLEAVRVAKRSLKNSPVLVPVYRHCYIPSNPNSAGNPVFCVRGGDFRYLGYDLAGFFEEFPLANGISRPPAPAWAVKSPRKIDFWSDLVEGKEAECKGKDGTCGWWEVSGGGGKVTWRGLAGLERSFEEMGCRLREGGWKEEEVREMMEEEAGEESRVSLKDKESVVWHVRLLSLGLRKAGWSVEDVVDSLGFQDLAAAPQPQPC